MSTKQRTIQLFMALFTAGLFALTPSAKAELVGTDQLTAQQAPDQDKKTIDNFLARADVQKKLQDMGLSAIITAQRVSLLSDAEAQKLAQKINEMPAGGNFSSLTSTDIIIILLGTILLVLIL